MPQSGRKRGGVDARSRRRAGAEPATVAGRAVPYLLPAELAGALRHLDDVQLDRLQDAEIQSRTTTPWPRLHNRHNFGRRLSDETEAYPKLRSRKGR